jgi:hypothetical protein
MVLAMGAVLALTGPAAAAASAKSGSASKPRSAAHSLVKSTPVAHATGHKIA